MMGWTEERVATLTKMWLDGKSSAEIAKRLGDISRNAVMGKVNRLGLLGNGDHNRKMTARPQGACKPKIVFSVVEGPSDNGFELNEGQMSSGQVRTSDSGQAKRKVAEVAEPIVIPVEVPIPVDPSVVHLSVGTIQRAFFSQASGTANDWRFAKSLVEDLTGQEFGWKKPGHKASLVAICTILSGDPRKILVPKISEPIVLGVMRELASSGVIIGGKTPERWQNPENGDASFFEDMLVAEGCVDRPRIEVVSEHDRDDAVDLPNVSAAGYMSPLQRDLMRITA